MTHHFTEDELTLYYYHEGRRRHDVEQHLESCAGCAATYREIAGTLAMIAAPEVPERSQQYGLEIWQRIFLDGEDIESIMHPLQGRQAA